MSRNTIILYTLIAGALTSASGVLAADDSAKCLMCHSAPGLARNLDGKQISLHVDAKALAGSAHAKKACVDCHTDFRGQGFPHKQNAEPVQCTRCHYVGNTAGAPNASPMEQYADSVHGRARKGGDTDAPGCKDCHRTHDIKSPNDPKSGIFRANIADTCGKCHLDSAIARRHNIPGPKKISRYKDSVHGKAVSEQGLIAAAVCTDCHGVHNIKAHTDVDSSVNKPHVPETCGKCHRELYKKFKESIHGQAVAKGVKDAPVCTDCHGEHTIRRPSDPGSSVYPTHVVATCSRCHENVRLERKYGLPANRLSTYIGSYHGVANKYGDTSVANCATCHDAHDIRPSSDPKSTVNKKNLPKTCGKCHPNASENFAKGSIHVLPSKEKDVGVYWVRTFYTGFIIVLIGSFCAYIALDLLARWRGRSRAEKGGRD